MAMIFTLAVVLISIGYLSWMLVSKIEIVRTGGIVLPDDDIDEHAIFEPRLQEVAKHAALFSDYAKRRFYQYLYIALERFTPWFHVMTLGVVRRLEHLTKLVQGKGQGDAPTGQASSFLKDIAQHKTKYTERRDGGRTMLRGMNLL